MPPHSPLDDDDTGSLTTMVASYVNDEREEESTEFTTSIKEGKTVSFNKDVFVYEHIHLNDFSDNEFDRTWHTAEELATIRAEIIETVRLMISGRCPDDDIIYCSRGLEFRTPAGSHLRNAHKYAVWDAVEEEQSRQWSQGIVNDESIAEVCHACSETCCNSAIRLAQQDAVFVQHELEEEEDGLYYCQNICCPAKKFLRGSHSPGSGASNSKSYADAKKSKRGSNKTKNSDDTSTTHHHNKMAIRCRKEGSSSIRT